ncbi:MAG: prepilin-type N-terminal cleavage/methylation domain-containing protein [Burkholderiales bacterium]|nr:prepilin-type N-terminal cleavage/methylation domain-containing protein [Burkholderiales bacterium]
MVLSPPPRPARAQRGMTLVEVLIAAAVGALLLAALAPVARLGGQASAPLRDTSEALYQGRFALQRVAAAAAATAPAAVLPPPAKSSGNWFGTVMFCVNATGSLVETTPSDTSCSGSTVIAERVSAFSVAVPATAGASDGEVADVSLTLTGPGGGGAITLGERMRLGGGTL